MVTKTNTLTPLILAAADGLQRGEGIRVESNTNAQFSNYTHVEEVTGSEFGVTGVLRCNNGILYDEFNVLVSNTDPVTGNVITSYIQQRAAIGSLSSLVPDGWAIDGWVYRGSLAAFGGMVAQRASSGYAPQYSAMVSNLGMVTYQVNSKSYSGRYNNYWGDPTKPTLGSSSIPAITQVKSDSISSAEFSGSLPYSFEKTINLPLGVNNGVDVYQFSKNFGMLYGYLVNGNRYLDAVRTVEKNNLNNFGYSTYQQYISQDWEKYKQGTALRQAFKNIGTMTDTIYTGNFGTVGAVTYNLLGRNLGRVGNLTAKLARQNVNTSDVMNPMYEAQLTQILASITDPEDLATIQTTVESTVPNMTSPLDYIDLAKCAGQSNDSYFSSFVEVGIDLYNKGPFMTIERGSDLVAVIDSVVIPKSDDVNKLASNVSLLPSSITNSLRSRLPASKTDTTVTMFDVMGSLGGALAGNFEAVNRGMDKLESSKYGPWIRDVLQRIVDDTNQFVDFSNSSMTPSITLKPNTGSAIAIPVSPGSINDAAVIEYENLLDTIMSDTSMSTIVSEINDNYNAIVQSVALQTSNWVKAAIPTEVFYDSGTIDSFAQSLPGYATDTQGVMTYEFLSNIADDSQTGQTIQCVMAEGKNYSLFNDLNINVNGYVA